MAFIAKNDNIEAVKALPWETIKSIFPTAYLAVIGEKWVIEYIGRKKETKETFVKGHWATETAPRKFDNISMAWEYARAHYSKGHARVVRVIPELELETAPTFHNIIMSDR